MDDNRVISTDPPQTGPLSFAVHLKMGMLRREPRILWMSPERWVFMTVDAKALTKGQTVEAREAAFRSVAAKAATDYPESLARLPDGCIVIRTEEIRQFQIIATFNDETNIYDDYERFILEAGGKTYKGAFERGTVLDAPVLDRLKGLLGQRYSYRTMEGFPFV